MTEPNQPMIPRILVAAAILERDGQVLLSRRPAGTHLAGLWEFPGGKVEAGESPEEAVVRELKEELGIHARNLRSFRFVHHQYPEKRVLMLTYLAEPIEEPDAGTLEWRWENISELDAAQMPEADREIVAALREREIP